MVRVCAPQGLIVITTPNIETLPSRLKFLFTGVIRGFESAVWNNPLEHFHPFTELEFRRGFDLLGLEPPEFSYAKPMCPPLGWNSYRRNFRERTMLRNIAGWIKWNTLWFGAAVISLLRYGNPNTNNRLFGESIVAVSHKIAKRALTGTD